MHRNERMLLLLAVGLALLGTVAYVGFASWRGYSGFPLDDAWIHQTYARNLAQTGSWAYVPGQPSAGSTSPLWTLLLTAGYALGVPYRAWAALLGGLSVALAAWMAGRLARQLFGWAAGGWPFVALLCAAEWHMLWAGASGMETALFAGLCLAAVSQGLRVARDDGVPSWIAWGLLGGLAVLTRPEGLIPFALSGAAVLAARRREFSGGQWRAVGKRYASAAAGFLLLVLPYLGFNWRISGAIFPNTFYAKQVEYAEVVEGVSWLLRVARVVGVQFVGGQLLLVPGLVAAGVELARRRRWLAYLPAVWWLVTVFLYASRLPVTYQHGRYQMPVIPVLLIYGVPGTWLLLSKASTTVGRAAARALVLAAGVVFAAFLVIGGQAYLADVRIIDSEMVDVAHWLNENTPDDALVAVHDIGAIGYFARRPLLDLAGLVSPEIIPFMRDESRLYRYIRDRGASYLVTFPSWYPRMTAEGGLELVYQTGAPWAVQAGGDNMAVYRLPR